MKELGMADFRCNKLVDLLAFGQTMQRKPEIEPQLNSMGW
jgi:hypothetical protein